MVQPPPKKNPRRHRPMTVRVAFTGAGRRSSIVIKPSTGPVWRQYLRAMGPGLVTGASDDDPSGIATYSQAGAQYGLSFLWAALLTLPLMAAVQEICDRTALATGTGTRRAGRQALPPGRASDPRRAPRRPHSGERAQHRRGSRRHRFWNAAPPRRADLDLGAFGRRPHHHASRAGLFCPHRPRLQSALRRAFGLSRRGGPRYPSVGQCAQPHTSSPT
jgi:hypothetical protein